MKKKISIILTLVTAINFILPLSANETDYEHYKNVYDNYYSEHRHYTERKWDGESKFLENSVYFVDNDVEVKIKTTLPASSMLVVRKNATLVLGDTPLYIKGSLAVATGGNIDITETKLVLNSGSVTGISGSVYVGSKAQIKIYSEMLIYRNASVSLNGKINVYDSGKLYYASDIKKYGTGEITGENTRIRGLEFSILMNNFSTEDISAIRFYDRQNRLTYRITDLGVIKKIINSLNKIILYPQNEAPIHTPRYEADYAIRAYDSSGNELFYFERPQFERDNMVYYKGVLYSYSVGSFTYDEFYYYAMGVRAFSSRELYW